MEFKIKLEDAQIEHLMEVYNYDNLDEVSWNILEEIRFQIKGQLEELEERKGKK